VRTGAECGGGCGLGMGSEVDGWPGGWFAGSDGWRCGVRGCFALVVSGPGWRCLLAVFGGSVWWQCLLAVFGKGEAQPQSVEESMS
jgi:hypothetical protein